MKIQIIKEYEKVETGEIIARDRYFQPNSDLTWDNFIGEITGTCDQSVYEARRQVGFTFWRLVSNRIKLMPAINLDSLTNKKT